MPRTSSDFRAVHAQSAILERDPMTGPAGPQGASGGAEAGGSAFNVSVHVQVDLHGATPAARNEFSTAVQSYADWLAGESQKQELSLRSPGGQNLEVTATAVLRAKRAMSRFGERAKPGVLENISLIGSPVFSGATGVMGSFLHSTTQVVIFVLLAIAALLSIAYLVVRRVS
jgi:hypothetical protein